MGFRSIVHGHLSLQWMDNVSQRDIPLNQPQERNRGLLTNISSRVCFHTTYRDNNRFLSNTHRRKNMADNDHRLQGRSQNPRSFPVLCRKGIRYRKSERVFGKTR